MAKNPEGTLTPKELSKKISSKSMGGIFLFYGEEQYRLESALAAIKKRLSQKEPRLLIFLNSARMSPPPILRTPCDSFRKCRI